jgi:hypothetical protein
MQYSSGFGLGKGTRDHYHLWECESIREVADIAATGTNPHLSSRKKGADGEFRITKSFEESYTLAVDGWHEIRGRVDQHLEPLREHLGQVLEVVRERMFDLCGAEVDIDRYCDGELECMIDDMYVEQPHNGKVFTMVVDSTLVWTNNGDDVAKRGATLCALVEAFDMLGFQLELWGEWTVRSKTAKGYASILTRFNHAGEPLDIDSMMFALGSPDWFRRIGFGFGEVTPQLADFGFGELGYYGLQSNGVHHADRVGASAVVSLEGNGRMVDDPTNWILDQLRLQGVVQDD